MLIFNNGLNNVREWSFLKLETQMVDLHSGEIWYPNGVKYNANVIWVSVLRLMEIKTTCNQYVITLDVSLEEMYLLVRHHWLLAISNQYKVEVWTVTFVISKYDTQADQWPSVKK